MMTKLTALSIDRLLADFVGHSEGYGQHLLEQNQEADRHVDRANDIVRELRARGPTEVRRLAALLSHENPWVRFSAAAHLVHEEPELAAPVLREIASGDTWVAISARPILQMWEAGVLERIR